MKKGLPPRKTTSGAEADSIGRLRAICLALPEATERETFGGPTFRVRDKIFAMETGRHGFPAFRCKAPPGSQAVLVGADPARFYVPPYVGSKGWIGVRLENAPDWAEVEALVHSSYRLIAPTKLRAPVA